MKSRFAVDVQLLPKLFLVSFSGSSRPLLHQSIRSRLLLQGSVMPDDEKFRVVLSYAQMAAILEHESLSETEISFNRIFGSLRLVGGIVELAGSRVLCAAPEPFFTKIGCVAMGVHGSDQASAGMHQLVTGKATDSFAFKIGASTAGGDWRISDHCSRCWIGN